MNILSLKNNESTTMYHRNCCGFLRNDFVTPTVVSHLTYVQENHPSINENRPFYSGEMLLTFVMSILTNNN